MKKNTIDFTTGSVVKKLLAFVLPIILSTMLQDLYNTADKIVVGQFAENGSLALGAVGSVASATNLLVYLFSGLSLGINVICSNLRGAKKEKELSSAMHTAVMLSVFAGTAVMLLGIASAKPMLRFIKTPDSLFDLSYTYMWIYFLGSPFSMLYNSGAGILLSNGDTKRPTVILICSGLVNLLLNLVLVVGCGLGVEGVALGTVASQLVSATWVLCILFDKL
jgi:putative MATE family efflux protein